jgi:asparagine synthase (glutamine-hydrolysing)
MQASSSSQREPYGPIGDEPLYRPSPFETAAGWLYGLDRGAVVSTECHEHPRIVLRDLLRRELLAGPCVVPFSGGRDSSMLLAVACDVAREAGLDQPTALTLVYPGHREADETTWQRQVLAHLRGRGLQPAWSQVRVDDEADVVGPLVAPLLHERRHGGPRSTPRFPLGSCRR